MEGLKGKVAIVTGGATLIGAAVASAFHREGAKAVIADVNTKDGEAVAKGLGNDGLFVQISRPLAKTGWTVTTSMWWAA